MVNVLKMKSHTVVEQQGVYIMEALVSRRGLGGSSNSGCRCCHMVHWLVV